MGVSRNHILAGGMHASETLSDDQDMFHNHWDANYFFFMPSLLTIFAYNFLNFSSFALDC